MSVWTVVTNTERRHFNFLLHVHTNMHTMSYLLEKKWNSKSTFFEIWNIACLWPVTFLFRCCYSYLCCQNVIYLKCFSPRRTGVTRLCMKDLFCFLKLDKKFQADYNGLVLPGGRRSTGDGIFLESLPSLNVFFATKSMIFSLLRLQRMIGHNFTDEYCPQQQRKVSFPLL